jgi:hypothetical protein
MIFFSLNSLYFLKIMNDSIYIDDVMTATPTVRRHTMYGRGHLRNSDSKRQVRKGAPMFHEPAEVRIARWLEKEAAEKAKREQAEK